MSGIKICFFVHECFLEAGHTRAMLEILRALPKGTVEELHLIHFESSPSSTLLPNFSGRIIHHKVPLKGLFPFLFKAIFFQICSFFLIRFVLPKDSTKIGIGTACLQVDLTNVQFVQGQWKPLYFKNKSLFSLRTIYKKVLFYYFDLCENYLFRNPKLKVMSLSKLVSNYLIENFQIQDSRIKTIYSSTNLVHFPLPSLSKSQIIKELSPKYPILEKLDLEKPIFLFVGAFERKGLFKVLHELKTKPETQLIVIGKPESGKQNDFSNFPNLIHIEFTSEIKNFYELSDCFIFPTIYEPFGLVIAEAAAMGNLVLVPRKNVGASEILEHLPSVKFIDVDGFQLENIRKLSLQEKISNAHLVRERLNKHSWRQAAEQFLEFIHSS